MMATMAKAADPGVSAWVRVMCAMIVAGAVSTALGEITDNNATDRRAAVAAARAEVDHAQAVVTAASARVRASWKSNEQLIAAEEELSHARREFDHVRDAVQQKLKQDPAYSAALREEADAGERVRQEQAATNATQPSTTRPADANIDVPNLPAPSSDQMQAATQRLEQKGKVRDLEDAAIASDPEAAKARARLDLAQRQMKVWQLQLDAALKNDPEYKAGMDQLAASRARVAQAAASYPDRRQR